MVFDGDALHFPMRFAVMPLGSGVIRSFEISQYFRNKEADKDAYPQATGIGISHARVGSEGGRRHRREG